MRNNPTIYFVAVFTASVFLSINSLASNPVSAFDTNSTSNDSSTAGLANVQSTNLDKVNVVPPSHTIGQATLVVAVNVNQDDRSKNIPNDLVLTAIGINGGSAIIPVSKASGPVILSINPGPYMIGEKQELSNNTKFGAEFKGDCEPILDESFKSTNAAFGNALNGQTKSCTVTVKFIQPS